VHKILSVNGIHVIHYVQKIVSKLKRFYITTDVYGHADYSSSSSSKISGKSLFSVIMLILQNVIAHSRVRLGRKTYIVDMAGGNKRTDYVAVSNTVIGLILLITGGISALASFISPEGIILVLSFFGLAGDANTSLLPELE